MDRQCNLCGGAEWRDVGDRKGAQCVKCASVERTRAMKIVLDHLKVPKEGAKILHLAPDAGLVPWFKSVSPSGYDPIDFDPSLYPYVAARKFDLLKDCETLPSNHYDLIIHLHVLEHIPINIAKILHHFHRALKSDGVHAFSIPIIGPTYSEDFGALSKENAKLRFGQHDHVRQFGFTDVNRHIGAILKLREKYSLLDYVDAKVLDLYNIPDGHRSGFNSSTIFVVKKYDYGLWL